MTSQGRRRGRRVAGQETKTALLAAAKDVFAERGFEAATVRLIASRCAVDPAMVNHWFGGKQGLFLAAIELPAVHTAFGEPDSLGERIVSTFVTTCDSVGRGQFTALVRSIGSQELAIRMLGAFVRSIVSPTVATLPLDLIEQRTALCCAHMTGLGMARYVLCEEPLASAQPETVVTLIAPSLEHYLSDSSVCDDIDIGM